MNVQSCESMLRYAPRPHSCVRSVSLASIARIIRNARERSTSPSLSSRRSHAVTLKRFVRVARERR
jgi:hypothetical protein